MAECHCTPPLGSRKLRASIGGTKGSPVALTYHPKIGDVLMCTFPACLREPEMVKTRPVVIMSKEMPGRPGLCTVVPLSTTPPQTERPYSVTVDDALLPDKLRGPQHWAKCDMLYTLSIERLDRILAAKNRATGKRTYVTGRVSMDDLERIREGVLSALSLSTLKAVSR